MSEILDGVLIELFLILALFGLVRFQVARLKNEVNVLKRDADNFGEILGTERAKGRKQQQNGENVYEIIPRTLSK